MHEALSSLARSPSLLAAALALAACGGEASSGADVAATDALTSDVDGAASDTVAVDAPPLFVLPAPITLPMGERTSLDLGPLVSDDEDPDAALTVSWTALHVALADGGDHVLEVIAPVDWSGTEAIGLAVADTAGHVARQTLTVIVVPPDDPVTPTSGCPVTFRYAAPSGTQEVLLSGSFNGWASTPETATALTDDDGDGVFEAALELEPGVWTYKFVVDGVWVSDPANARSEDDGFGGKNSVRELAADCSEPAPCGLVTFRYAAAEAVASVFVAGDFNGWSASASPLADPDGDHVFEASLVLAVGSHQYKFVVDGAWVTDPDNPQTADDGFGGKNSVLDVSCASTGSGR